jgi:hypothetical protein
MVALAGRIVTCDRSERVLADGVVFICQGRVLDVRIRSAGVPSGFERTPIIETKGTLFPGLIELHNHLSYNALPLWAPIPAKFEHRGQWPNHKDYRRLVSGPMTVLGRTPSLLPALVRYVECKCLLGGVTTSQGIMLNSNAGIQRFYKGLVRNVEQAQDPDLPDAEGHILDVEARDAAAFLARMMKAKGQRSYLLHLSEGVTDPTRPDSVARRHFLALEVRPNQWAISDALSGIHATGLLDEDFRVLARNGASMIWSPLSNLLLYGGTARVEAAREAGVRIGIGSDWSPTGSKNLLGELKVAWLYSQSFMRKPFSARDLVLMATRVAAEILKWNAALGSLEAGKCADLVMIEGTAGDPYDSLIRSPETSIHLVMINGVARFGTRGLMAQLAPDQDPLHVGGKVRGLYLDQPTADPDIRSVSLKVARATLARSLHNIQSLARDLERPRASSARLRIAADRPEPTTWSLALDEIQDTGMTVRPRLPFAGPSDFTGPKRVGPSRAAVAARLSDILGPIELDPLTVADDSNFLKQIAAQPNLPKEIRQGLAGLY